MKQIIILFISVDTGSLIPNGQYTVRANTLTGKNCETGYDKIMAMRIQKNPNGFGVLTSGMTGKDGHFLILLNGTVSGGALWLTIQTEKKGHHNIVEDSDLGFSTKLYAGLSQGVDDSSRTI